MAGPPRIMVVEDQRELAQLLGAAIEAAGMRTLLFHTGEDAHAFLEEDEPEAAIVDLVLPDLMGSELVLELSARGVPVVVVTGVFRGEAYRREAEEEHGAAAFFEKPFSTQEVLDTVTRLIGWQAPKSTPSHRSDADPARLEVVDPTGADILSPQAQAPSEGPAARMRRQMGFVEDLIEVGGPQAEAPSALDPFVPATVSVTPPSSPDPREAGAQRETPAEGNLGQTTVPRLLVAYYEAKTSGALRLQRGKVRKIVYIREGHPIFAASNLATDRLLTFAANAGRLTQEDAEAAFRLAQEQGRRVGEVLIEAGLFDRSSLRELVLDQVRQTLWGCFDWREGTFAIDTAASRAEPIHLDLPLGELILEGTRRAVSDALLEAELPDDLYLAPHPAPAIPVESLLLSGEEAQLLAQIDGTKSVADLLALSDLQPHAARALLHALRDMRVVGPRQQVDRQARRIGYLM